MGFEKHFQDKADELMQGMVKSSPPEEVEEIALEENVAEEPTEQPEIEEVIEDDKPTESQETQETPELEVAEDDGLIEDWDDSPTEEHQTRVEVDWSLIGKDLGLGDVKDKESLLKSFNQKIESIRSEAEGLAKDALSTLPDDLKEAIEVAKNNGDYREFLGVASVDYDNYSAKELFVSSIVDYFRDEKGQLDEEALNDHVDGFTDKEILIEGEKIRRSLKEQQMAEKQAYKAQTEAKKREDDRRLSTAIDNIKDINGFVVNQYQKSKMYSDISSGAMMKKLFYNDSGELDFNKIVSNYFKVVNHDKIVNFLQQRVRNATKKEIIESLSNAEVEKPSHLPNATPTAKKSGVDLLLEESMRRFAKTQQ